MKKYLAVAVILLFIGLAVAPSINASVVEDGLVEFDVEFCGLGKKHSIILSQQEADEVNLLFVELYKKLETTESSEERNSIITQAITEFDKFGLLDSLSVEQVQKLVLGKYEKEKAIQSFEMDSHENSIQENQDNYFCFVSGVVRDGYATGQLGMIGGILALLGFPPFRFSTLQILGLILMIISEIIVTVFPLSIMQSITIFSANIISLGLFGLRNHDIPPNSGTGKIFGFNGIKLTNIGTGEMNLLGFALAVIDFSND